MSSSGASFFIYLYAGEGAALTYVLSRLGETDLRRPPGNLLVQGGGRHTSDTSSGVWRLSGWLVDTGPARLVGQSVRRQWQNWSFPERFHVAVSFLTKVLQNLLADSFVYPESLLCSPGSEVLVRFARVDVDWYLLYILPLCGNIA